MDGGLIGGIVGTIGGLAGGIMGTYFSIRNTNGPRERAFVIRCSVVTWVGVMIFLGGLLLLPPPWKWLMWIPYGVLLPLGIIHMNRNQARIRAEETTSVRR